MSALLRANLTYLTLISNISVLIIRFLFIMVYNYLKLGHVSCFNSYGCLDRKTWCFSLVFPWWNNNNKDFHTALPRQKDPSDIAALCLFQLYYLQTMNLNDSQDSRTWKDDNNSLFFFHFDWLPLNAYHIYLSWSWNNPLCKWFSRKRH